MFTTKMPLVFTYVLFIYFSATSNLLPSNVVNFFSLQTNATSFSKVKTWGNNVLNSFYIHINEMKQLHTEQGNWTSKPVNSSNNITYLTTTHLGHGRLGNQMFRYASLIGIARAQGRKLVIAPENTDLEQTFKLTHIEYINGSEK
jgi:hypothetical protein